MTPKTLDKMKTFYEKMFELYEEAEYLRDCTGDADEKEVFNETRASLYELKFKARKVYYKWGGEA